MVSRWAAVLGALAIVVAPMGAPAPASAAASAPVPVVEGNTLVDDSTGEVFVPRGVNWPSFEYACWQGWGYSGDFGPTEAATMASWGINTVRVPLNQDCWLGLQGSPKNDGRTAAGYRSAVAAFVGKLNAAGIVALLDLHSSAPAGHPAHGQRAMADAQSVTFWNSVATRFASAPSVMFDLFNEPYSRGSFHLTWNCWRDGGCSAPVEDDYTSTLSGDTYRVTGMADLVAAVRGAGAGQPILLGGLNYANDLTGWLAHAPDDDQLVAAWHNYPGQGCSDQACWNAQVLPVAAVVPVVTGEFGQTDGGSSYLTSFMGWADEHGIGYLPWAWWDVPASESVPNSRYALIDSALQPKAPSGTAFHDHLASLDPDYQVPATTVTTMTASASSQRYGGSGRVTLIASVTRHGAATRAGSVTFTTGSTTIATVPLNSAGRAILHLPTTLRPGYHSITATFEPSGTALLGSSAPPRPVRVTTTSTAAITPAKPTVKVGSTWTAAVRVTAPGVANPVGTVSLYSGANKMGSWTLAATDMGVLTISPKKFAKTGPHKLTVRYAGTSVIAPSVSPPKTVTVKKKS